MCIWGLVDSAPTATKVVLTILIREEILELNKNLLLLTKLISVELSLFIISYFYITFTVYYYLSADSYSYIPAKAILFYDYRVAECEI